MKKMAINNENWTIRPLKGFGKLNFGMTMEQVSTYNQIYGEVDSVRPINTLKFDEIVQAMQENDNSDNAEEFEEIIGIIKKSYDLNEGIEIEIRHKFGLQLDYKNKILCDFFLDGDSTPAFINGLNVFSSDPKAIFQILQKMNNDLPYYGNNEVVFENLYIYMFSFVNYDVAINFFKKGDEEFGNRSITLRKNPRRDFVNFDDYTKIDFMNV